MRASNPYWLMLVAGFRSKATYRLATVAGIFVNSIFGVIRASVLLAVAAAGHTGYTRDQMAAFVWLGQAMLGLISIFPSPTVSARVRSGDIAIDYIRPVDIQFSFVAQEFGKAAYAVLPRALPTLGIGWLITRFTLPATVSTYLLGAVSVILAVAVSHTCCVAYELISFWVVEMRGFRALYMVAGGFAAGLYVPLALMPGWLATACACTPFPAMLQYPIDVLSGRAVGAAAWHLIGIQVLWLAVVVLIGRVLLARGHRKLVVQGG